MSNDVRSVLAAAVLVVGAILAPGGVLAAVDPGAVGTWELVVPTAPIPEGFIELPRAIEVARRKGLAGPIDSAKLIVCRPPGRERRS